MADRDVLTILVEEFGRLLAPLGEAVSDPDNFTAFLRELGWDFALIPAPLQAFEAPLGVLGQQVEQTATNSIDVQELIGVIQSVMNLIDGIKDQSPGQFPSTIDFNEFKNDFPGQLVQFLAVEYLESAQPLVGYSLKTLGIIRERWVDAAGLRPAYRRKELAWNDLVQLIDDPLVLVKNAYNWGDSQFDVEQLTRNLAGVLAALELEFQLQQLEAEMFNLLAQGNLGLSPYNNWMMAVPILQDTTSEFKTELGVGLYFIPETASAKPGFSISPYARGNLAVELDLTETLKFSFEAAADLNGGIAIIVRPDQAIQVVLDIISTGGAGTNLPSGGQFSLSIVNQGSSGQPLLLMGSENGSRLEYLSASMKAGVQLTSAGESDLYGELELNGAKLVIQPGDDADSFLAQLLPGDGFNVELSLTVGLSSAQGFYFRGSGGLEIQLPAHLQLGIIEIQSATLALKPGNGSLPIELGGTIKGDLGVMKAVVENIGLRAEFTFPSSGGNLGPADLSLEFKPPNGVGLTIDAGAVTGGGYLFFDFDKEEYAGVLELDLSGIVSVKAVGLITTRMPDGSKGFSLLLIITAEFGSPIQLGFGFTLSAVGGLLGLNRTMRLEAIAAGIRDGGINSIMFPDNVVENAPRIISDLKNYFPVEEDTFLIGPMVMIGWGTPNLVTVSLGIIIEIPGNIAILGVLKVALPDEEAALIVIQVNFIGAIEFDKQRLWFFAALFDSRVLYITLEGEMGLLVGWGDDASFVVSVGGFHPAFNPPPLPFGAVARIAISILNTDFARIRVEGYFAVTSNSVQFGASVELYFGLSAFNIDGHLAFDALFRFSPFYFIITISASLSVKVFGVGLFSVRMRGSLEGPTPWHVEGTGSISLLFFDIDVDFSHTWGEEAETTLPPISVMPLLVAEYQKSENWMAALPSGNRLLVSLRSFEGETADLILHPVGSLKISQRAVPLELTIDKVGNQKPSDANHFNVTVNTTGIDQRGEINESFAVGQFFDKSDDELLNAKSFEPMKGGVELSVAGEQYRAPEAVKRVVRYEKIILDTHYKRFVKKFYGWFGSLFGLFLNGNAVTKSAISYKQQKQLKPFAEQVEIGNTLYTVAFNEDNTAFSEEAMSFTSQVQAQEFINQQISGDPNLAKQLHVIPQVEMQRTE